MAQFEQAWEMLMRHEGREYENVPFDKGGPTKFGITLDNLPPYSTAEDIKNLTEDQAKAIAIQQFWNPIQGDHIEDQKWATILFDQSYLRGVHGASLILASIDCSKPNPQLAFDFLKACAKKSILRCSQDATQVKFLSGWLNRLNDLEAYLFGLKYKF